MHEARRTGRGVRLKEWHLSAHEASSAVDQVLAWCREVVSNCRRPFGIEAFDLAVACRLGGTSGGVDSHSFLRLRPVDLYTERLAKQLNAILVGSRLEESPVIIAAAIFSWGDAAHRALPTHT
jgi:hypothetical protein